MAAEAEFDLAYGEACARMAATAALRACLDAARPSFGHTTVRPSAVAIDDGTKTEFLARVGQGGTDWSFSATRRWVTDIAGRGDAIIDGTLILDVLEANDSLRPIRVLAARWRYDSYEPWYYPNAEMATVELVDGRRTLRWDLPDDEALDWPAQGYLPQTTMAEWSAPQPSPQLQEILSWRIACEIVRHDPELLRILELHPGGGQYDCLSVYGPNPGPYAVIHLNRGGSAHVFNERWEPWTTFWADAAAAWDLREIVRRLRADAGIPDRTPLPSSTPRTITYRTIASAVSMAVTHRDLFECRNGVDDNSGDGGGIREEWFNAFPATTDRRRPGDGDGDFAPEYRFWFLLRDGEPILGLHDSGLAVDRLGGAHDLTARYRKNGRRIAPIAWQLVGDELG